MTIPEAAETFGLNTRTLLLWIQRKRLPAIRVGRDWTVTREDVARVLACPPKRGRPKKP